MNNKIKEKIDSYIESENGWMVKKIFEVVSRNSVNAPPGGNENNAQEVIENIYSELGLNIDRFSPDDIQELKKMPFFLEGRTYKNRDNLVGQTGLGLSNTLIFNGHIDTVPSEKFDWKKSKPLEPVLLDGRIYGQGACDMKAGIIAAIFALKTILDLDIVIKGRVIIESVVDEEFGGANGSLACVLRGYKGDLAIIPEPSSMTMCVSNVCSKILLLKVKGGEGLNYFGRKFEGTNAIILASKLLLAIKDYEDYLNSIKNSYSVYSKVKKPMNFLFSDITAGEIGPDKIMTNPAICSARVYIMNYPDIDNKKFDSMILSFLKRYPELKRAIDQKIISIEDHSRFIEGGEIDLADSGIKKILKILKQNAKDLAAINLKTGAALGGTDFFAFNNYGNTPCLVLGPGGGNLHAADEFVNLKDLLNLSKIFSGFIYDFCCR